MNKKKRRKREKALKRKKDRIGGRKVSDKNSVNVKLIPGQAGGEVGMTGEGRAR